MSKRRTYRDGGIDQRGEKSWRLRYRVNGRRFTKTMHGTKSEAQKALRDLLHSGDTGEHVAPDKMTLGQWIEHWVSIGCPGNKRRKEVGQRTLEGYEQTLRRHVVPTLGDRPLQQIEPSEIDKLYVSFVGKDFGAHGPPCAYGTRGLHRRRGAHWQARQKSNAAIGESALPWRSRSRHGSRRGSAARAGPGL